jgi:hypothetical protein
MAALLLACFMGLSSVVVSDKAANNKLQLALQSQVNHGAKRMTAPVKD